MGKKNKKSRAGAALEAAADGSMPKTVKRDSLEFVNLILEKCSQPFGQRTKEWDDFMEVYQIVEKLRARQKNYVMNRPNREEKFPEFLSWLHSNGVDTEAVTIEKFEDGGYGLKATRDIDQSSKFMTIPRKLMLSTETAKASVLGPMIAEDRILQSMPNVVMALHLLCECNNLWSFWEQYLNILPDSYTTPLYFRPEEFQLLKGSPALSDMMNQYRNIARQYAYFFKLFQGIHNDTGKLTQKVKNFCYDDYRWAVSTVMTRQNLVPSADGQSKITALIPMWDMCNHINGEFTTDFNRETGCVECYALNHFTAGEQVYMFYGYRSNSEFLIHNGFVYPANHNDKVMIKLGMSKTDPLYGMKSEVMSKLAILPSRPFQLHLPPEPISSDMIAYLRTFVMDKNDLACHLVGEDAIRLCRQLKDMDEPVNKENEMKAWDFLTARLQLLVKCYPTTEEEDQALLDKGDLTEHARLAVTLRMLEKKLLKAAEIFSQDRRQKAEAEDPFKQLISQQIDMDDLELLEELDIEAEKERLSRAKQQQGPWASTGPLEPLDPHPGTSTTGPLEPLDPNPGTSTMGPLEPLDPNPGAPLTISELTPSTSRDTDTALVNGNVSYSQGASITEVSEVTEGSGVTQGSEVSQGHDVLPGIEETSKGETAPMEPPLDPLDQANIDELMESISCLDTEVD